MIVFVMVNHIGVCNIDSKFVLCIGKKF
jgi:hypothetical protein